MPIFADISDSMLAATSASTNTFASMPTLGALSPMMVNMLVGVFLIICIMMILLVLIQRPQGGGLSGAFGAGGGGGSSGAGQTAFGTKTGDVLTWATIGIFVTFVCFAIFLNFVTRPDRSDPTETAITAPAGTVDDSIVDPESAEEVIDDADESIDNTAEDNAEDVAGENPTETESTDTPANDG